MALLINKIPWTQQPQVAVGIDLGNPVTANIFSLIAPNLGNFNPASTLPNIDPYGVGTSWKRTIGQMGVGGRNAPSMAYRITQAEPRAMTNGYTTLTLLRMLSYVIFGPLNRQIWVTA